MNKNNLGNTDINLYAKLPFSQACENNKDAILEILRLELQNYQHVLEVGSGTGQHSVYFAANLPHVQWQTSDVNANHTTIKAWHDAYPVSNLYAPLTFDLRTDVVPYSTTTTSYDAVFTANTLHIIAWSLVEKLFASVQTILDVEGKFIIYGPFNESGQYTSESNHRFDISLRQRDPNSGIRDKEDIIALATSCALSLSQQYKMPANNEILVFKKLND